MAPLALQSNDHRELFDTVDGLRTKGISRYVDLPQIIVCGDQSAGKSSALEAITPGSDRSPEEAQRLSHFHSGTDNLEPDLGSIVEEAKRAMGLSETKVFSTDTLRVELCGPTQPHPTMVDLPGIFRAGNKDQSVADAAIVRKMVRTYMESSRSIILCVVSAKKRFFASRCD